ncbi:hypothetical protein [Cacatuid alphaherpesvirus 2]|uniref:Uncharacterized protein n=1 Tax=Cacatuid alphaherpesvirus 2 TaxID=2604840 RepID=A0A5B9R2M9_9ALPH|nr:hypothetical protein QKT46_gp19 [Cacatuid alphaherpesvirus 2]QEG54073.1 hypothetical protein [Cacatuid alphaherpesvirus 2]
MSNSKAQSPNPKFRVISCCAKSIVLPRHTRGTSQWYSLAESSGYQLSIIKGIVPEDCVNNETSRDKVSEVAVRLFECGVSKKPVYAAAKFYPKDDLPEADTENENYANWIPVTAVIMTRIKKYPLGGPKLSLLADAATLTKRARDKWSDVILTLHRARPMIFAKQFLSFELDGEGDWTDGIGLLMLGVVSLTELCPAAAAVRAFNSSLLLSSCHSKLVFPPQHPEKSQKIHLDRANYLTGLKIVTAAPRGKNLVFRFKENVSFGSPVGVGLVESKLDAPAIGCKSGDKCQPISNCSAGSHVIVIYFRVEEIEPENDLAYKVLDAWAAKASHWLLNKEGRPLLNKILDQLPVCSKFMCAAYGAFWFHHQGILLHFHWNPENPNTLFHACVAAVRQAWKNCKVTTLGDLL